MSMIKMAEYYPHKDKLKILDISGFPSAIFYGNIAHRKAMNMAAMGHIMVVNTEPIKQQQQ